MILIFLPVSILIMYGASRTKWLRNHPNKIVIMIVLGLVLFLIGQILSMVLYNRK
ncbi:MAG: hypothetical protein ACJ75J_16825 [Cytophagaceae bacterium]